MDRQCSSCGGFCKKSGCERENVQPKGWVGLTEAERLEIIAVGGEAAVLYVTEAKLRGKNSG